MPCERCGAESEMEEDYLYHDDSFHDTTHTRNVYISMLVWGEKKEELLKRAGGLGLAVPRKGYSGRKYGDLVNKIIRIRDRVPVGVDVCMNCGNISRHWVNITAGNNSISELETELNKLKEKQDKEETEKVATEKAKRKKQLLDKKKKMIGKIDDELKSLED